MVTIVRDLLVEWWQVHIHQQVVMAGIRLLHASRRNARIGKAHADPEAPAHYLPIRWPKNVDPGILRHRVLLRARHGCHGQHAGCQEGEVTHGLHPFPP